jgi:hypothetical protein
MINNFLDKIVEQLWAEHTDEMKQQLKSFKTEFELVGNTHFGYGLYIRNRFHLRDNETGYIIRKLWEMTNTKNKA